MNSAEKPLEYLISRAVDPFITEEERNNFTDELCSRIGHEYEGPYLAMKFLSYRLLSPNQEEALNTLNVMDICIRKCGSRINQEIGKYRLLNQFIRLLSPKYQGLETSDAVKEKAIKLLYQWKQSMRYIEKLQQVYNQLKEQGIIDEDPTEDMEIIQIPKPSPRVASFEDEERSQLLAELLKSKSPEDLQAANRLIKSMVRSDEQKMHKHCEQRNLMDTAIEHSTLLQEILNRSSNSIDELFLSTQDYNAEDIALIENMQKSLLSLRPTLFRYASEAAETQDDSLGEILNINDQINKALQLYNEKIVPQKAESIVRLTSSPNTNHLTTTSDIYGNNSSSSNNGDVDLLSILSRNNSPAVTRKEYNENKSSNDLNIFDSSYKNESPKEISLIDELNSLKFEQIPTFTMKQFEVEKMESKRDTFLLDDISVTPKDLTILRNQAPIVFINEPLIRGILYFAYFPNSKQKNLISSKLLPSNIRSLDGFHPIGPSQNITQVLLLLPMSKEIKESELCYEMTFESQICERIEGKFTIRFPQEE
uniref:ADP-ribosylation factor-binding protein GGA1 n=1 Tax=Panagrolaimus sp. ES5 TaxID=591445 RepID=A0AC34GTZ9_9BILA